MAEPPDPELPKPVVAYAAPYAAANAAAWESEVNAESSIQKNALLLANNRFESQYITALKFTPLS